MTAPTLVSVASTSFATAPSGTTRSSVISVLAGDLIVVLGVAEGDAVNLNTPTATGNTFANPQFVNVSNYSEAGIWTATAASTNASLTVSQSFGSGGTNAFGFTVFVLRDSDGFGASSKTNVSSGAPSLGLTTTQADSAILVATADWNAADGTSRTWRTVGAPATEDAYFRDASRYTVYIGHHANAGTVGAKTVGLSAPSGQKYSIVAIEIKGTSGSVDATVNAVAATLAVAAPNPSASTDANLVAVVSTDALAAPAAVVRAGATVVTPVSTISVLALAPVVTTTVVATSPASTVVLDAPAPVVTADQNGDVLITSVVATVSELAPAPVVTGTALVSSVLATVGIAAPAPVVGMHVRIDSPVSNIAVQSPAPSVVAEGDAIVTSVAATVAVSSPTPALNISNLLTAVAATQSTLAPAPTLSVEVSATTPASTISVAALPPAVLVGTGTIVDAVVAVIDVQAQDPILVVGGAVIVEAATAILDLTAIPPSVAVNSGGDMDSEYTYYAALSGLVPKENFSLNDHRRKYWKDQLVSALDHIDDLQYAYYPNNTYEGFLVQSSGTRQQSLSDLKLKLFNL